MSTSLFSTLGRTAAVLPLAAALYVTPAMQAHAAEDTTEQESVEISDPLEGFNRAIYGINTAADILFIGPASTIYSEGVPEPVQGVLGNIVDNLKLPLIAINHLLQGDFSDFGTTVGRFVVNSTVGIAGAMDIATDAGLPERKTDFGITLASWGLDTGPYLVLPLFGPSKLA
jgi:phospholipid-binding lipoprotein MlaA